MATSSPVSAMCAYFIGIFIMIYFVNDSERTIADYFVCYIRVCALHSRLLVRKFTGTAAGFRSGTAAGAIGAGTGAGAKAIRFSF